MSETRENDNETETEHQNDGGEGESNNETSATRKKSQPVAESKIDGSMVTFTFTNGAKVSCDVAKLPQEVQFQYAVEGVRTAGRLAFQKMEDPTKAHAALSSRFERMQKGEATKSHRSNAVVDDLTQALVNVTGKPLSHIENVFYPRYFASPDSGCTTNTDKKGKVRIFNKKEALAKLRLNPEIRAELDKLAKARANTAPKGGVKVDLAGLAA